MLKKKVLPLLMILFIIPNVTFADTIQNSKLATGTEALLDDLTTWLPGIAVAAGIVVVIFFSIMRGTRDEMEKKKWTDRIETAVTSTIFAVIAAGLLRIILSYYGFVGK